MSVNCLIVILLIIFSNSCNAQEEKQAIFEFGSPEIFVTTDTQNFNPYSLIDKNKRTFMLNEYMMTGTTSNMAHLNLILFDPNADDIVRQNLGKEQYWTFINSTGVLPAMSVTNTTFKATIQFHTEPGDKVAFHAAYVESFVSKETLPPYDVVFEIPANSRSYSAVKTVVDFQSWGLLRWKLSIGGEVTWDEIKKVAEPLYKVNGSDFELDSTHFKHVANPCIPDFFLLALIAGDKYGGINHVYFDIPAFHLYKTGNFYNMTPAFCESYDAHEECGNVQQLILTNDHLIALSDKGIFISASLNVSDANVGNPYETKPLIYFNLVDPCRDYPEHIVCFPSGASSMTSTLIHSVRLHYTPICNLHQLPNYDDMLIVVIEHAQSPKEFTKRSKLLKAFTVLYSRTPYKEFYPLFFGRSKYDGKQIHAIPAVFYNHQRGHFDVTAVIDSGEDRPIYKFSQHHVRFFIAEPKEDLIKKGYRRLNGFIGDGYLDFHFPPSFFMTDLLVNPGSMDVMFIGNQIWISESATPFVYLAFAGFGSVHQKVERCNINHPDRDFVCLNSDHTVILLGRVGEYYGVQQVNITEIEELRIGTGGEGLLWPQDYFHDVVRKAHFTVAFSGSILMWYLYDKEELKTSQSNFFDPGSKEFCAREEITDLQFRKVCYKLYNRAMEKDSKRTRRQVEDAEMAVTGNSMDLIEDASIKAKMRNYSEEAMGENLELGPYFRMISLKPSKFKSILEPTDGPLVPLLVDSVTAILYEGMLPGEESRYIYISNVHTGSKIYCPNEDFDKNKNSADGNKIFERQRYTCELYIRHMKPVSEFLPGFRLALYVTIIKAIPMTAMGLPVRVEIKQNSNVAEVDIPLGSKDVFFTHAHIGQTLYIPGNFSILLQGFKNDYKMIGFVTRAFRKPFTLEYRAFTTFLIDMSTYSFKTERSREDVIERAQALQAEKFLKDKYDEEKLARETKKYEINRIRQKFKMDKIPFAYEVKFETDGGKPRDVVEEENVAMRRKRDEKEKLLLVRKRRQEANKVEIKPFKKWTIADGGCNFLLQLEDNPVLKSHGGRVTLDLHDAVSFSVKLRPMNELGRLMLYRPLLLTTNSNPKILHVEKNFIRKSEYQRLKILLQPTGAGIGVASFVVRTVASSMSCQSSSSMTFIIQVHRAVGRRLHVDYPIQTCKPSFGLGMLRPWKVDRPNCITHQELLDPELKVITRKGAEIFRTLEPNYRPPSIRGVEIPMSRNVYNAAPDKPKYKDWYRISKESSQVNQCYLKKNRSECDCSDSDKLSDDEKYSDCKEKVYVVKRGYSVNLRVQYDPIMQDSDQHPEFFYSHKFLSVYMQEINGRVEYTLSSEDNELLKTINSEARLNEGKKFYDAETIRITLHGTGLYHFKVGLGRFDTFEEVTGYFILYSVASDLNDITLMVIMLLTITICFGLVFCAFLRVRSRLANQLPNQAPPTKIKAE